MFTDIFVVIVRGWQGRLPPASSGQKLGVLLNTLLCPGQHLTTKSYSSPNVSHAVVESLWLRDAV